MNGEHKYRYLPEVGNKPSDALNTDNTRKNDATKKYPCPCYGYLTLPVPQEEAIAYICPVCYWENDVFTSSETEKSDENHGLSLRDGRINFLTFGSCDKRFKDKVRKPLTEEIPT